MYYPIVAGRIPALAVLNIIYLSLSRPRASIVKQPRAGIKSKSNSKYLLNLKRYANMHLSHKDTNAQNDFVRAELNQSHFFYQHRLTVPR